MLRASEQPFKLRHKEDGFDGGTFSPLYSKMGAIVTTLTLVSRQLSHYSDLRVKKQEGERLV